MNKSAIERFAKDARRTLIAEVSRMAARYGITERDIIPATADSVNGTVLTRGEKNRRVALIKRVQRAGYRNTVDEIAYTWFNRFCALRFLEVNNYLPSMIRVFTGTDGTFRPQILDEAASVSLDGLDTDTVIRLKIDNREEDLYRYLLITQCNALNAILPHMFRKINDEAELLLPDNLLREDSVIAHLVADIPEDDWRDAVQIIGWLYQYYNSEPKDLVFANLKKNIKISKDDIPAATQLFTPDWIVRYMVENSLGRIFVNAQIGRWSGSEADRQIREREIADRMGWKYYLPEAEQSPEVRENLNNSAAPLNPETLKVIDPCMGSGHILTYFFDVLMQIYRELGYRDRDAVASILKNNLCGLDIDDRASQLAYFAVMMKARQYDRAFFSRHIRPNVFPVAESNAYSPANLDYFAGNNTALRNAMTHIIDELHDAKEYGSILNVTPENFPALYRRFDEITESDDLEAPGTLADLLPLVQCADLLSRKYDAVVTNPPYMGGGGMEAKLADYIKRHFKDSKSDLFAVFIDHGFDMLKPNGYSAMVTMQSWMFLSSFEDLRTKILDNHTIECMVHMANMVMGIAFGTSATIWHNPYTENYQGNFCFVEYSDLRNGEPIEFPPANERNLTAERRGNSEAEKERMFLEAKQ